LGFIAKPKVNNVECHDLDASQDNITCSGLEAKHNYWKITKI
jgi:hypothetical protein